MKTKYVDIEYLGGSYKAPADNPIWTLPDNVGEIWGKLKTFGPWQIPLSYKALAMSCDFGKFARLYGLRTMTNIRESGYDLEGRVSIAGRKYRAFTSSMLMQRSDGSLCSVATIHVCIPRKEEEGMDK